MDFTITNGTLISGLIIIYLRGVKNMRFSVHKKGDTRTITRFALFPKTVNGEVVWLEKYEVLQRFETNYFGLNSWVDKKIYPKVKKGE